MADELLLKIEETEFIAIETSPGRHPAKRFIERLDTGGKRDLRSPHAFSHAPSPSGDLQQAGPSASQVPAAGCSSYASRHQGGAVRTPVCSTSARAAQFYAYEGY
jgi:hypothetical protein